MALICLERKAVEGEEEEEAEASSSPPPALPLASPLHPDTGPTAHASHAAAEVCRPATTSHLGPMIPGDPLFQTFRT